MCFVSDNMMYPYNKINTDTVLKIPFYFIREIKSMTSWKQSMPLLDMYWHHYQKIKYCCRGMWSNFRCLPPKIRDGSLHFKTHELCFTCVHLEANASGCLLKAMLPGFSLGRCISEKCEIICVVCVFCSFWRISSASSLFFLE